MSMFIMIAAGGGIGGGGILVPLNIFVLGFQPHIAIPLSNATILGSSFGQILLNYRKRHPLANRPLINWDIMLAMEPLTVAGAVVGSVANVLCPPWLLCVMLVLLLGGTTFKTLGKGIKMYKKESAALEEAGRNILEERRLLLDGYESISVSKKTPCEEYLELIEEEKSHSFWKIAVMCFTAFGTLVCTIAKGFVPCGSMLYWTFTFAVIPFTLAIAYFARRHLVEWNQRNTIVYPSACSIAGLCAGLFGIGGGIVKGPLMLEMGVLPQVASATSATCGSTPISSM